VADVRLNYWGREVGGDVRASCDANCDTRITRSDERLCGGTQSTGWYGEAGVGCGGYFCDDHLVGARCTMCAMVPQRRIMIGKREVRR
jgi:hypothetical protein